MTSYESNICLLLLFVLQGPRASTQKGPSFMYIVFCVKKGTVGSRDTEQRAGIPVSFSYLAVTTASHDLVASATLVF